jgi:diguanylate cyclase (GGDEF)-like protein/PAS domain S-box-containing protein
MRVLSILMVLVGALFLSLAFLPARKILRNVSGQLRRKWLVILNLMTFFLLGYLLFDVVLFFNLPLPLELVTGGVFLGGAVFVFIIINLSQSTITAQQKAEEDIKLLNESLEQRVAERTRELERLSDFNCAVLDSIADPISILDVETFRIVDANQAFLKEINLPEGQIIGRTCYDVTHHRSSPCTPPHDSCPLMETLSNDDHATRQHVHWTLSGEKRYVEVLTSPIRDEKGKIVQAVHIQRDITERKQSEENLRESRELLRVVVEGTSDAIYAKDIEGRYRLFNTAASRITGKSAEEVFGRDDTFVFPADEARIVMNGDRDVMEAGKTMTYEEHLTSVDGKLLVFLTTKGPLFDEDGNITGIFGVARDITERKLAEGKITTLAYSDHLTGLPNRLLLLDRCEQAIAIARRNGTQMALLFFDLDHFKDINDTLGHHAGDLLLKAVSSRILKIVRSNDTLARLGGDEFVLLCTSINYPRDAGVVAKKIIELLHQPFEIDGKKVFSNASIGIVIYPDDGSDSSTLLKHADLAMYAAKEQGRKTFNFFSDKLNVKAKERATIEEGLRHAMQSDQLLLHYQPQVELGSGRVFGVEALCRWLHPVLGFIAPDKFIPIAEQTGMIREIGYWVLKTACRQCNEWHRNGFPLSVAVNVSIFQLQFSDFPEMVNEALDEAGLSPEYLELEITESLLMNSAEKSVEMLRRLKSIGVKIAIDDFGTGYSSLSYLNKFSLDRIKIDQSFIREITLRNDAASIVRAIVVIGHSLGLKVIAEGVETAKEQKILLGFSCDEAQGYLYSKPMPAFDVGRLIYSNIPLGMPIPLVNLSGAAMPIAGIDSMRRNISLLPGGAEISLVSGDGEKRGI